MRLVAGSVTLGFAMAVAVIGRADPPAPLKLVTYNLDWANPDRQATLAAIADLDADVVLLQEIDASWAKALHALDERYPHRRVHPHEARLAGGIAIFSKLPIAIEELIASPLATWFPAERVVLDAPSGKLQLLNVHLRPAVDGDSWVKGFVTTPPLRRREIETYWPHVSAKLPTIVAGDFNEADDGKAIDFLVHHGLARVPTAGPESWHYELLKITIDHVLVDDRLTASDGHVVDAGTSDHRPVAVTIAPR